MVVPHGLSRQGVNVVTFWIMVILVVVADQATKAAVCHLMDVVDPARTLIPGLFNVMHIENTGAAFSIGEGSSWLFVVCAAVVFVVTCFFVWTNELPLPLVLSLGCVAGGGVGNMIDRLANGSVTDFIATTFIDFPVFNVADIFVTCGVIVSVVFYLRWDSAQDLEDDSDLAEGRQTSEERNV